MTEYLDILREWQTKVLKPCAYEHVDVLFPAYQFRRINPGEPKDHWASRYKLDKTIPKSKNSEKSVIYRSEMRFREQGDWKGSAVGILDFYMQENGIGSVYEASRILDDRFNLSMPRADSSEIAAIVQKKARKDALLEDLMAYFAWNLEKNSSDKARRVRSYLLKSRGFTMEQAGRLNLGFVPEWSTVIHYITGNKGYRIEELEEACEVRNFEGKTSVGKTHTLAIPYECAGVLKGFIFRRIDTEEGPKYMASQELDRKSAFFNIKADPDPKDIVVVEGEFDALKATAEGIENVVAIGGSEIAGERRKQVEDALFRRGVKKIILCLDLDAEKDNPLEAKTRQRHEHIMRSIHTIKDVDFDFDEIYVASFPEPSDPDEYIRTYGVEAFRDLLERAVPYWKYLSDYMSIR